MTYESKDRQWFALSCLGNLFALGDCGDFDAATEIADDLGLDAIWIADVDTVTQWIKTIQSKLTEIEV
tara:strand:- start:1506 stop:1709 length:204 start_codon:yes stop_codon:yes gene_type:complete